MAAKKIAISAPESVLKNVDKMAKKMNLTRSRYITTVLMNVTKELEKVKTTEKLNEVFADKALLKEQKKISDAFLSLDPKEGQEW